MSLVWLCHVHKLGTFFLNWLQTNKHTDQLRALTGSARTQDMIPYTVMGHPSPGYRVARSPLRAESDTFVHHGSAAGGFS